jgi:hypothetical protein
MKSDFGIMKIKTNEFLIFSRLIALLGAGFVLINYQLMNKKLLFGNIKA